MYLSEDAQAESIVRVVLVVCSVVPSVKYVNGDPSGLERWALTGGCQSTCPLSSFNGSSTCFSGGTKNASPKSAI